MTNAIERIIDRVHQRYTIVDVAYMRMSERNAAVDHRDAHAASRASDEQRVLERVARQ
jgi:hypothetical protein